VSGDTVANGFAIEVEDRGLGMSPQRLAELNERLASSPEFNPSDSEQLGLFVVSQLAKRHGIRVTLKASPYGGTTAVALIPGHLVVTEEAFRAGLPGEAVAIGSAAVGPAAVGPAAVGPAAVGPAAVGPAAVGPAAVGPAAVGRAAGLVTNGNHPAAELAGPGGSGLANGAAGHPGFDLFTPLRRGPGPGDRPGGAQAHDAEPVPAETDSAGTAAASWTGSAPYPGSAFHADQPAPFPGWTGRGVAGGSVTPGAVAAPGSGAMAGRATPMTPVASPRPREASGPPWELSRQTGPLPAIPVDGDPEGPPDGPGTDGEVNGLPRRVKQASLAPQLRGHPPSRRTSAAAAAGAARASGPTPAEIRQTMSALQRGWQEGRSQRLTAPAPDDPPAGPAPGADGDRGAERPEGRDADEPLGESGGT
jgi:hypothetical protein